MSKYLYGVFYRDKMAGTNKFGMFTRFTDAVNLVKMNGAGSVRRKLDTPGITTYDAPTFHTCSTPVFVLAENPVTKDIAEPGKVIQIATAHDAFPIGNYGIILHVSRRGAGKITVQPVRPSGDSWVNAGTPVELPMSWCTMPHRHNPWEV